jgi:hypothetical protein
MSPPLFLQSAVLRDYRETRKSVVSPLRKRGKRSPDWFGSEMLEIIIAGIPNKKSGLLLSEKFSGL